MIRATLISLILFLGLTTKLKAQDFYGMVQVDTNLWIDQTEITNNEYRQFVNWVKDSLFKAGVNIYREKQGFYDNSLLKTDVLNYSHKINGMVKLINVYPDTTVWEKLDTLKPFMGSMDFYFHHPAYDDYPIVGISYDQAIAFCIWRTNMLNNFNHDPNNKKAKGITVKYDLPSIEQWNTIAYRDSSKLPAGIEIGKDLDKNALKYFDKYGLLINSVEFKYPQVDGTIPWHYTMKAIETYGIGVPSIKNPKKETPAIVGLAGNVAEMTKDAGAVGGSWYHPYSKAEINEQIEIDHQESHAWLGFRCIVTIIEN